jgi:TetR/AcrR family transcriptional regulator, transcriptional repressor for nem operon
MRDPEKTRTQILNAAFDTIYRNGFRASSVKDIASKAGVTEGAFFHYFHTKNDLGYALTDEVLREMMVNRWTKPLAAYENPVQGMIVRFRKLMESTSDEDMSLGCPLNNLTQEMAPVDPVFKERLRGVLALWVDETERYLKIAQARGYLKPGVNPRQVAEFAVMVEEGSAALVKNLGSRRLYWSLYESFREYMLSISSASSKASRP